MNNIEVSVFFDEKKEFLSSLILEEYYKANPKIAKFYGDLGKQKCKDDIAYHLVYLSKAIEVSSPTVFSSYIGWAQILLSGLGIASDELEKLLHTVRCVIEKTSCEISVFVAPYIEQALSELQNPQLSVYIPKENIAEQYLNLLIEGQRHLACRLILNEFEKTQSIADIYINIFQPVQYEIGRLWQTKKITVAEEHYCTAATQLIMSQLYPYIMSGEKKKGILVAACVGGDLHELGLRMVADFFELEGWKTFYLGANVPTTSIIDEVKKRKANILALSTTMTFHLDNIKSVIASIHASDELKDTKIIVGGYFFNLDHSLWQKLGADGYAKNAKDAIQVVNKMKVV